MTDDMIKEHLVRAHLAESVTLDAGTWTEVLEEVLRLREVSYDLLGQLTAHRAAQSMQEATEALRPRTTGLPIGNFTLTRYDGGYWLAHASGEGMQVSPARLQTAMDTLWQDF